MMGWAPVARKARACPSVSASRRCASMDSRWVEPAEFSARGNNSTIPQVCALPRDVCAASLSQRAVDRDVVKVRQHFAAKESLRAYIRIRRVHNEVRILRHWKQCDPGHIIAPACFSTLPPRSQLILNGAL